MVVAFALVENESPERVWGQTLYHALVKTCGAVRIFAALWSRPWGRSKNLLDICPFNFWILPVQGFAFFCPLRVGSFVFIVFGALLFNGFSPCSLILLVKVDFQVRMFFKSLPSSPRARRGSSPVAPDDSDRNTKIARKFFCKKISHRGPIFFLAAIPHPPGTFFFVLKKFFIHPCLFVCGEKSHVGILIHFQFGGTLRAVLQLEFHVRLSTRKPDFANRHIGKTFDHIFAGNLQNKILHRGHWF